LPRGKKLFLSSEAIAERVRQLGEEIGRDFAGRKLVVIGILKGSFIFLADMVRQIDLDLSIDFLRVASYGTAEASSGRCRLTKNIETDITGRDVLLVEDIADSGQTLAFLHRHLLDEGAASIATCVLIDKRERRQQTVRIDYSGFTVETGFLVGYGLDCAEQYRNLPAIYTLDAPD